MLYWSLNNPHGGSDLSWQSVLSHSISLVEIGDGEVCFGVSLELIVGVLQSKQSHVRQNLLCPINHLTYSKHITRQLVTCDCVFLESLRACLDVVSVLVPPWWLRGREMTATIRISSPLSPSGLFGMWHGAERQRAIQTSYK